MTSNNESDEDIASEVLPAAVEEAAVPLELLELQSWHRPRKQYIRYKQWAKQTERLIGKLRGSPFFRKDVKANQNYDI